MNAFPTFTRRGFINVGVATAISPSAMFSNNAVAADASCQATMLSDLPLSYALQPALLGLRANTLLKQIAKGYGFYGLPRNWVNLTNYEKLSKSLQQFLLLNKAVEEELQPLIDSCKADVGIAASYAAAISAGNDIEQQFSSDVEKLKIQINQATADIDNLAEELVAQKLLIDGYEAQFDIAVMRAAAGQCGLSQVLQIAAAVVAVAAAVYTAGTTAVAAYSSLASLAATGASTVAAGAAGATAFTELKSAYETFKPIVKTFVAAKSSYDDIKVKYDALMNDLPHGDYGKVLVEQTSFDELSAKKLNEFDSKVRAADIGAADPGVKDRLITAVHAFFELAQARNRKIYDHDAALVTLQETCRRWFVRPRRSHLESCLGTGKDRVHEKIGGRDGKREDCDQAPVWRGCEGSGSGGVRRAGSVGSESARDLWRLQPLRRWSHEQVEQVLT